MISLRHPSKFQRVSRLGFVSAATSLTRGQPNFARCFGVSWGATLYIHFRGLLTPNGILPRAKFTLRPSLAFSYIGSVTARHHAAAGVSQTLRRGTRNGITELSQRAPPIFGWAAITFGIGPHFSWLLPANVESALHAGCKAVTGLGTFSARIVIYLMLIRRAGT